MASLSRQKYQAPTISGVTEKIFANLEALKYLYRNEEQWRANTYKDIDENTLIPSVLFWADRDLHYTIRQSSNDGYVGMFTEFDSKVPLRDGNFKRTEMGYALPEMLDRDDDAKPGDNLVTKKQTYINFYQDENAKIGDIHLRTTVDWHNLDFAKHFNDFSDYNRITNQVFAAMHKGIALVDKLLVDTFICSLFGGYLHTYPIGHPLYRFFTEASDSYTPDETFSKDAAAFFKLDGKIAKKCKEIAKWTQLWYKAKFCYLTNIIEGEVIGSGQDKKIPEYTSMPADTSDKEKCLKAIRAWYLRAGADSKYTQAGLQLRRLSLYSLVSCISGTVRELTQEDTRNWCGHDFYSENKDKRGYCLNALPTDLVCFMNDEDLEEARFGLKGSPAMGSFTEAFNGTIERIEQSGVVFVGLNYILPGHAAIFDKNLCFRLKEFYQTDDMEYFAYHLVMSRIKHVFKKPIIYSKTVARVLQPGANQQYAVPLYWGSKHLPFLVEK